MSKIKTEDLAQIGKDLDLLITAVGQIDEVVNLKQLHQLYMIAGDCKLIHEYLRWLKVAFPQKNIPHLDENLDKIQTLIRKLGEVENTLPVI